MKKKRVIRELRSDARPEAWKDVRREVRKDKRRAYGDCVEEIYDISSPQNLDEICASHYFTSDSALEDELRYFDYVVAGKTLHITSNSGVFSKNHVDRGSELLIRTVLTEQAETPCGAAGVSAGALRIADLGTGYGIILLSLLCGLENSRGTGFEVSNRALRLARINAKKNKLRDRAEFVSGDLRLHAENPRLHAEKLRRDAEGSDETDDRGKAEGDEMRLPCFDLIVTNPPIRAGKDVVYAFFDFAKNALSECGSFYAVISKNQGANSARKYLETLFGNAEVVAREGEFRVIKSKQSPAGKAAAGKAATGEKAAAGDIATGDAAERASVGHTSPENTSKLGQNID